MQFINQFFIKICNKKVGVDEFGNQYYQSCKNRRFVVYNGIAEPSKIPANWHCWIHHTTDALPQETVAKPLFSIILSLSKFVRELLDLLGLPSRKFRCLKIVRKNLVLRQSSQAQKYFWQKTHLPNLTATKYKNISTFFKEKKTYSSWGMEITK